MQFALILIIALFPCFAQSNELENKMTYLGALAFADYQQSVDMFFHEEGFVEINPILGKYPSRRGLLTFGIASLGIVYAIAKQLPDSWATIFIDSVIASEEYNVYQNTRVKNGFTRDIDGIAIIVSLRW